MERNKEGVKKGEVGKTGGRGCFFLSPFNLSDRGFPSETNVLFPIDCALIHLWMTAL